MGQRFPGTQGIGPSASEKVDAGTLARGTTHAPGLVSDDDSGKQKTSWTREVASVPKPGEQPVPKLGEIYFRTNEDVLDTHDEQVLNKLCADLQTLLKKGWRIDLTCTGNADHRATDQYNLQLGERRAAAVKRHIDAAVRDARLRVLPRSEGESKATQPGQGKARVPQSLMALDRRVDIVFGAITPPVRIGMKGNWMHTRSLEKLEIDNGGHIFDSDTKSVTVMIRTDYRVEGAQGARKAKVECVVTRLDTNAVIFTASGELDADRIIMRKGYKATPDSRVTRVILPGSEPPPPGATIVDVRDRATTDQAGDLLRAIFDQLRGKHRNITERVEEAFEAARQAP